MVTYCPSNGKLLPFLNGKLLPFQYRIIYCVLSWLLVVSICIAIVASSLIMVLYFALLLAFLMPYALLKNLLMSFSVYVILLVVWLLPICLATH
jgi:hypothetical protein